MSSYSSINPSSANASGSFTPPTNNPLPGSAARGVTMKLFVRDDRTMIAAAVQGDVDGIFQGSHVIESMPDLRRREDLARSAGEGQCLADARAGGLGRFADRGVRRIDARRARAAGASR